MSDWNRGEKLAIRDSGKSLRKYGSTCNHIKRPEFFIAHRVEKTDTLQGLALRYNTTMEQIRRVNRLFANDSLFLRDSLKIPVPLEMAHTLEGSTSSGSASGTTSSISTESFSDDEEKSVNDFLCKIDSVIATTREHVKHVQENSHFVDPSNASMVKRRNNRRQNSASLELEAPHPVVLNQGRKVRNSLQRLEKEQDALFEL